MLKSAQRASGDSRPPQAPPLPAFDAKGRRRLQAAAAPLQGGQGGDAVEGGPGAGAPHGQRPKRRQRAGCHQPRQQPDAEQLQMLQGGQRARVRPHIAARQVQGADVQLPQPPQRPQSAQILQGEGRRPEGQESILPPEE